MRTNTLVLTGLLAASLAGCEVRCLSGHRDRAATSKGASLPTVQLVAYHDPDGGEPDDPSDAGVLNQDKLKFRSETNARLARVDAEMAGVKASLAAAGERTRSQFKDSEREIDKGTQRVKRQLQDIGPASNRAYQDAKKDISHQMDDLEAKMAKLRDDLLK